MILLRGSLLRVAFLATLVGLLARSSAAQTGENVLIVANLRSLESVEIADYYARKRQVPADQIIRLDLPVAEQIERRDYDSQIERPIGTWLNTHRLADRVLYLVLTKGVPLRIAGSEGHNGTVASVDSELTLLYRRMCGVSVPVEGSIKNPYFLSDGALSEVKPFTHERQDIYLVARLDGFSVSDVKGLIDRGSSPSQQGVILLDGRSEWTTSPGNRWLEKAATMLKSLNGWGERVLLDLSGKVLRDQPNVFGYYSWGSNDPAIRTRHPHLQFMPGALAAMFVSSDARTFQEPPEKWEVRADRFGGTDQSLTGDLVHDGVTGVAGHVAEPYLNATIRPDILFPAYVSGFNLVESFYLAMPFVSWQTIVLGDPLCAPFRQKSLSPGEIDRGIDATTELPLFLSERRVSSITGTGIKPQAAKLFVKAEMRSAHNDVASAVQALEEATRIDNTFVMGHVALAGFHDQSSQWDAAIDRYRRAVALAPQHVAALNNLAYDLAVHRNAPAEALPIAKRAFVLAKGASSVADTLGWVYHLAGDDAEAEPLLVSAIGGDASNAELHFHLAAVLASNGKSQPATAELRRALELDKALDNRDEVRQLRQRLDASKR